MNPSLRMVEKRRETRHPARGAAVIRTEDPDAFEIRGELVDISTSGFRVAHGNASLRTGQTVAFEYPGVSGTARVVWNRIYENKVETGFVIVQR